MINEKSINQLFGIVEDRLQRFTDIPMDSQDEPIRIMVLYTFIDSISAFVYPDLTNRERFVKVILEYGCWNCSESISWPHLSRLLELTEDDRFDKAKNKYLTIPKKYRGGVFIDLEADPTIGEVLELWPVGLKAIVGNVTSLNSLRHVELMYSSRNKLVHQNRESGNGWDIGGKSTSPFYHELISDHGTTIELVYPIGFVFKLARSVAANVRKFFEDNDMDPYTSFDTGSYYVEKLNIDIGE